MDFLLALHSHLPYVLNHGRWPHGSDWICEAAVDTYLPLLESLNGLETEGVPGPLTLGITPILANQLGSQTFATELEAFFRQRFEACDEAIASFEAEHELPLVAAAEFWRGRLNRLHRLFDRIGANIPAAFGHHESAGRIELMSSAATHGFLPLLGREESIRLQLMVGRAEHERIFGRAPAGCWVPECAYRPRGPWHPHPQARYQAMRPGVEEFVGAAGFKYFFTDSHLAQAGRPLGLYGESALPEGFLLAEESPLDLPAAHSPYRTYQVYPRKGAPRVATLVRDPRSSRQVWSRYQGYPGDGSYLEFHKIRFPGGLKFWKVTGPNADLGDKDPYDPNGARARAHGHAGHFGWLLSDIEQGERQQGGEVIVTPFDTELFGHWWFEGTDFLGDLYRAMAARGTPRPSTASDHLDRQPPVLAVELAEGSWGANGDFSKWLNPETEWTWIKLWSAEDRFWDTVPAKLGHEETDSIIAQAGRELLLAQASDWQFIISTGAAGDYATTRFIGHLEDFHRLMDALVGDGAARERGRALAAELRERDDVFPNLLETLRQVVASEPAHLTA
ncbi:MAG: 1,4-alpha-glucan branching protein domain-containing protein [Gemmatimonadota bacterium]